MNDFSQRHSHAGIPVRLWQRICHRRPCPGALPANQNSPQRAPLGLYAEQISHTPFTAPRAAEPAAEKLASTACAPRRCSDPFSAHRQRPVARRARQRRRRRTPNRLRWDALPMESGAADFVDGMATMGGGGDVAAGERLRRAHLPRQPLDDAALLLQRRRRIADRAAAGAPGAVYRDGQTRGGAGRDRGDPARSEIQGGFAGRPGARLCVREPRRAAAPAGPRADRLQRPGQSARFSRAGRRL